MTNGDMIGWVWVGSTMLTWCVGALWNWRCLKNGEPDEWLPIGLIVFFGPLWPVALMVWAMATIGEWEERMQAKAKKREADRLEVERLIQSIESRVEPLSDVERREYLAKLEREALGERKVQIQ